MAKKCELPLYIGTPAAPVVFDKPRVVALDCNIHDWMLAYIYVLTTPYSAKTRPDGKARVEGLAPGAYGARVRSRLRRVAQVGMADPTPARRPVQGLLTG